MTACSSNEALRSDMSEYDVFGLKAAQFFGAISSRKMGVLPTAIRRSFVALGAFTPNICFAFADISGIVYIAYAVGIALLLASAIAGAVIAGKHKIFGAFVGMGVSVAIVAGFGFNYFSKVDESREFTARIYEEQSQVTQISVQSLEKICTVEEQFVIHRMLPAGSSIYLHLLSNQSPPSAEQAPPVVQTDYMKEQVRRVGFSFPPSDTHRQYKKPIDWMETARRPETIAKLVGSDLVEWNDHTNYYRKPVVRLATKERWIKDGLREIPEEHTKKYGVQYQFANWSGLKAAMPIGVDRAIADYVFTVDDISTVEDRAQWLGRGRIRLSNARTNAVLAEYTGFQAILNGDVCPNAFNSKDVNRGKWDLVTFFFSKVVQAEDTTPR